MTSTVNSTRRILLALSPLLGVLMIGCAGDRAGDKEVLRLATTTSTRDSGLLDVLVPKFESEHNCRVDVVAVGTGAALKLGEQGDADALLVHAPQAEEQFMSAGHGTRRETFMFNFFTILGPPDDPAGVQNQGPIEAMMSIASGKHRFISRGDDSGTHKRELSLWAKAGGRPEWQDYWESGQGMGATLVMADEKQAYVLTDRGTYLKFKNKIDLIPLGKESELLLNKYSVIVVDADKHEKISEKLAEQFADFLTRDDTQQAINDFQIDGQQLFHAMLLPPAEE
jgi:tungstate transport system substrate-binding protein